MGVFFEVVNESNKALEKLHMAEKEDFRRMLFLFWWLVKVFEVRVSPKDNASFQIFYKEFYQDFPFLRYKVEEAYNIKSNDCFPIFLKEGQWEADQEGLVGSQACCSCRRRTS